MYVIFNKDSSDVVSLSSGNFVSEDEQDTLLKSMFPNDPNLRVWHIEKSIPFSAGLKVVLDSDGMPNKLVNGDKILFKEPEDAKKKLNKILSLHQKNLSRVLSRRLARSIDEKFVNFWIKSSYTQPDVSEALSKGSYFNTDDFIPISWWGTFTDAGGYANMNRSIVFRLHNHKILPKIDICPTANQVSGSSQYLINKYSSFDYRGISSNLKVFGFTPIAHNYKGIKIFYTMMETESLHPEFARLCNDADEVWVPSTHNKKVFSNHGVRSPIKVMPLGIDENLYNKALNKPKTKYKNGLMGIVGCNKFKDIKNFRFISLFGWSYRKGPDILIRSFVEEFDESDDVCLIVAARHCGSSDPYHVNLVIQEIKKYAHMVRKNNLPQIWLYPHVIPESEMISVYKMGDAFISTSRGEGFSLPQIEAGACGLPIISCNNTGMSEYINEKNSFVITNNKTESCNPEMHWITHYYHGQLFPKLGREQIDQARNHMRFVCEHYSDALEKSKYMHKDIFDKYTWEKATARISSRIREIYR